MTNREVLAKFIRLAFNIEITNNFTIKCGDVYCPSSVNCEKCPASYSNRDFWDKEFIGDENVQINNNERVAIKEISW